MDGQSRESFKGALARFEERVGSQSGAPGAEELSSGLFAVADLLDRESSLRRALVDPAAPAASRQDLVSRLLQGQVTDLTLDTVRELVGSSWSGAADLRAAVELLASHAALAAVEGQGALDEVEDELFRFARLLEREPQLRGALTDQGLPIERKLGLVQTLLGERAHAATVRLVSDAVSRRRSVSLERALEDLSRLAAERRQRLVAQVRVARELDDAQSGRLSAALKALYGRDVALQVEVDPKVLGGAEVRVGDEVLDGTVAARLGAARRRLAG